MKRTLFVGFAIFTTLGELTAEPSRFREVERAYGNYTLFLERKMVELDGGYAQNWENITIDDLLYDTTTRYCKGIFSQVQYQKWSRTGREKADVKDERSLSIGFQHTNRGFRKKYFFPKGSYDARDTVRLHVNHSGSIHREIKGYWFGNKGTNTPFLSLDLTGAFDASYTSEENTDPFVPDDELIKNFFRDKYIGETYQAVFLADLAPGIGIGRQINVVYIYLAFQLEKELLRCRAINFPLSKTTILRIARFLSRNDTFRLKNHDVLKKFIASLDSIILKDEAADVDSIRYLSPFEIRRLFTKVVPPFDAHPKAYLFGIQRFIGDAWHTKIEHPYDTISVNDYTEKDFTLSHDALLGVAFECGFPLTRFWFLSLQCIKPLLSKERNIEFYDRHHMDWKGFFRYHWDIHNYFWMGSRVLIECNAEDIQCYGVVPNNFPFHVQLKPTVYIEDYISIKGFVSLFHTWTDRSLMYWRYPLKIEPAHGFSLGLNIEYRF